MTRKTNIQWEQDRRSLHEGIFKFLSEAAQNDVSIRDGISSYVQYFSVETQRHIGKAVLQMFDALCNVEP